MKRLFFTLLMLTAFLIPFFAHADLTKTSEIGRIEVQENGVINAYTKITITENGEIISTRESPPTQYTPGQDVSTAPQKVQDMANTVWTSEVIAQYASDQTGAALTLDQQKAVKLKKLYSNIKYFTNYLPNGFPRYDSDLKMGVMNAIITAIAAGETPSQTVLSAKTWLLTVQGLFVTKKTTILAAEDETALNAIDITIDTLEAQYGRSGSVLADPGVSTADLIGQ